MIKPKISAKAKKEHYPAPFAIIDNWVDAGIHGNHAFTSEIESICKLAVTETAKNLLRVFFLTEKLKNQQYNSEPKDIKHVHVLGAGVMGGDIAAVSAMRGFKVTLQDLDKKQIGATISRARKLFSKKLKKQHLINDALDRLIPDPEGIGVKKADLIIEAIVENLSVKQEVFVELEKNAKPSAILATNTSTIPLDQIASKLKDQSRLVGIHFFNPVAQMMLVEVIHFEQSSMQSIESAIKFVQRLDKLPIRVKSSPGFLVNRVLLPYLSEAMLMLEEGIAKEDIDKVAKDFGMPMGPIELADTVGLDVCVFAQESLAKYLDNVTEIPRTVRQMLDHKKLGRKTGEGFYKYSKGKIVNKTNASSNIKPEIKQRLMLRLFNEVAACIREEIVAEHDLIDAGLIYGSGFPPFLGGPVNYMNTQGSSKLQDQLSLLGDKHGVRFSPDHGWTELGIS
jgi:3-hydroxyacyl-CoA dehydrogenase/enoyl-CoA hydratase/3-hydroxybutyryl-CoA epimerase